MIIVGIVDSVVIVAIVGIPNFSLTQPTHLATHGRPPLTPVTC